MATVSFDLPENLEKQLRAEIGDLDAAAEEAALVELYRQRSLSHHQLGIALDLSRFEVDGLLKRHNVTEDLVSLAEFNRQQAVLRNAFSA